MTNTGDFRRYSYGSDASYALQAFSASRSSAAPKYRPQEKRERELKVHTNTKLKTKAELMTEQKNARIKAVAVFGVSLLAIAMFFAMLFTNAQKNELRHEISNLNTELSVAQSENTRINSELNALVSMSMIDEYAVEQLGMTKIQSGQINYIDVSEYKENQASAVATGEADSAIDEPADEIVDEAVE